MKPVLFDFKSGVSGTSLSHASRVGVVGIVNAELLVISFLMKVLKSCLLPCQIADLQDAEQAEVTGTHVDESL